MMCCGSIYFCATRGELECAEHGGFDSCCADTRCYGTVPYEPLIERVAARVHQAWRKEQTGSVHRMGVNVAATPYSKLPAELQVRARRTAWSCLRNLSKAGTVDRVAELVHQERLRRDQDEDTVGPDPLDRLPFFWLAPVQQRSLRTAVELAARAADVTLES